jgi:hypothetical protein
MGISGGEMGIFVVILGILAVEGLVFSQAPGASTIWTPSAYLSSASPPTPPQTGASCGWNPFCSVDNTAASVYYGIEDVSYYLAQIFAVIAEPISAIIVIATFSAQYGGILAWFNGIAAAVELAIFVHGLV